MEIILINDGSTDGTKYKCEELKKKYDNLHYFEQENSGPGMARNLGLQHARGKYITFLDADDYIDSFTYYPLIKEMEQSKADVLQFGHRIIEPNGKIIKEVSSKSKYIIEGTSNILREYVTTNNINNFVWNKIFRKNIIVNIKFPKLYYHEDQVYLTKIMGKVNKLLVIDKIYHNYVMTDNSLVRSSFNKRKLDNLKGANENYVYLKSINKELASFPAHYICFYISTIYHQVDIKESGNKKLRRRLKNEFNRYYKISKNHEAWVKSSMRLKIFLNIFLICPLCAKPIYELYVRGKK